jgi:hypothetical protein
MTPPVVTNELETAILDMYRGPLDGFVGRRDALVKQLRATKQREAADRVKALRKPSRMAWVLDSVVHEDPASIDRLAAAIEQAQTGADLRAALESVKAAVRDVAAIGARVAVRAGQPIEPSAVITALQAVIGDAGAFADLRGGQLVEVPEGGGLDMLAAMVQVQPAKATSSSPEPPRPGAAPSEAPPARAKQDAELAKAARAALQRAEVSLAEVSKASQRAAQSVVDAREKLAAAERALLSAQSEAEVRRAALERLRNDAETAAAAVHDAEQALAAARARVAELDR